MWGTNRGAQREKREINRYCYLTIQGGHDGVYLLRQVAVVVPARCIKQDFFFGGGHLAKLKADREKGEKNRRQKRK